MQPLRAWLKANRLTADPSDYTAVPDLNGTYNELSGFRRDVKVWWQNVPNDLQDERIVGLTPHLGCC